MKTFFFVFWSSPEFGEKSVPYQLKSFLLMYFFFWSSVCGVSKCSSLRLRLTGSVVQPCAGNDLLSYKAIDSNYLSFVVTSMLVFHIATGWSRNCDNLICSSEKSVGRSLSPSMLKIGKNWGKNANYPPQCSTKICTTGAGPLELWRFSHHLSAKCRIVGQDHNKS